MDVEKDTLENLMIEPETQTSAKDEAFIRSENGELELNGKAIKLEPFDSYRQIAAQKLGMEFLNMGEEALEEFQERQTYNGIFLDAVICIYLCTKPRSVSAKALNRTSIVRNDAMAWAESNKIRIGNANHAALIDAFGAIISDIIESIAEVDETGLPDGKESLGE